MNENIPTWSQITSRLVRGQELDGPSAAWAMDQAMSGQATAVQLAGFLVALQAKGVTSTELAALADAMVSHARPVRAPRRRSEEHTSELQSRGHLVCRLLLEKKKDNKRHATTKQRVSESID